MKQQRSIRTAIFLSMILLLIASLTAPAVVHAAPPAAKLSAAPFAPTAFDCSSVTSIPLVECQALVALFTSTNGTAWTNNTGWLANTTPCAWYGITCSTGHVTQIVLNGNLLLGMIPPQIGDLINLRYLVAGTNKLNGSIPPEIGKLTNLEVMVLGINQLSGPIPPEIGNLTKVIYLNLSGNALSGSIPPEIGKLVKLQSLTMSENQFSGPIPHEFGNLTLLTVLSLNKNQLSGPIPPEIGHLTLATSLALDTNQLTGPIPHEMGNLIQLTTLTLNDNHLSGSIPPEIGNLTKLTSINFFNNKLTSSIPPEMGNLVNLKSFMAGNNLLTGSIPPEIGKLVNVETVILAMNQLSGSIPPEIGSLAKVGYLNLSNNNLTGSIPPEIGKLSALTILRLRFNQLSGSIPAEIGSLPKIGIADLQNNQFCGAIPVNFGTNTALKDVTLSNNYLILPVDPLLTQLNGKTPNDLSWAANQTPGACGSSKTLLALYVLAYDNDPLSPGNLSAYFTQTVASIASGTLSRSGVRAVILADRSGPGNVAVFEVSNGIVTQLTDNLPALSESSVVNGAELGGFLDWARTTYPADRTTLTYLGHNKPLPQSGLETLPPVATASLETVNLFPLPIKDGAHADYTDNTPTAASLSVYDFSEALRLASHDGAQPLDVVDISSCFSMSIEEMYALRHYTLTAVGSPNYAFFEPALAGASLKAINTEMSAAQMAVALVSIKDATLPADGHPRILVALDMSKLDAIKQAWDTVSYNLWLGLNDTQLRQSYKEKMAQAYNYSHKYDCTFCQPQDWALETPDALVDMGSFSRVLGYLFGSTTPVGMAAADTNTYLTQAVIAKASRNGVPWFGNPAKTWDFTGNTGLSLYADLIGKDDGHGHIVLSDIAAWYNRTVSSSNPHPYEFVQTGVSGKEIQASGINWSDVFAAYWQGATNLVTQLCLPTFPPVLESGDLIAGTVISPVAGTAKVGIPVTVSATVTSTTEVHNVQVSILVYQNQKQVFTDLVNVPVIKAGEQIAVPASQPWTPTESGAYVLRYSFDSNNHIAETNEKNNLIYFSDIVGGSAACPRPEIKAQTLQQLQWWTANTIQLTLEQLSQTAPSSAARVNRLVIDFYQFHDGESPYNQVPGRVEQRTMQNISLPQSSMALPLSTAIKPGRVVMHIWPSSDCGGLGIPQEVAFNYLPNNATLAQDQAQYFTLDAQAGQKIDLTMNVTGGSTRMYVWLPGNSWSAQSITNGGTLTINPTAAGRYLVSVVGMAASNVYTLTAVLNGTSLLALQSTGTVFGSTVVTVVRTRPEFSDPLFINPQANRIFIPITIR